MGDVDNTWIFDSLVGFLNGPVWNAPIQSFIEEKSLIFENITTDNPDYVKIFEDYKNLVDVMLASYMEDIGISPLQFEEACNRGTSDFVPKHFDNVLFDQIWAANDYDMFKRMMTQRNVELQLQALELIETKYGIMPESFIPHKAQSRQPSEGADGDAALEETDMEEEIMEEVIKNFPRRESLAEGESSNMEEEVQYIMEEKNILQQALKSIEERTRLENLPESFQGQLDQSKDTELDAPTEDELSFGKKPISKNIDQIELQKRQEYLRGQRDKLVALKKEARKKHLEGDATVQEKIKIRPKSSRIAKAVLTGDSLSVPNEQLKIRKALAERLRNEVIGNNLDF